MPKKKDVEIKYNKLILCEGRDEKEFFIWLLNHIYGNTYDIQVMDNGGVTELNDYLRLLTMRPNYSSVQSIIMVRDAEADYAAAVQSVQNSIKSIGLAVPNKAFEFSTGNPKIGFVILPCVPEQAGTLENLCLELCSIPHKDKVKQFLNDHEKSAEETLKKPHKNQLHTLLSISNDFVGLKIGEAAKAGAFDWTHKSINKLKKFIEAM